MRRADRRPSRIANDPGDTIEQVRAKERAAAPAAPRRGAARAWKACADSWCAGGSGRGGARRPVPFAPSRTSYWAVARCPTRCGAARRRERGVAEREQFFHWTFEFPEVFHDPRRRGSRRRASMRSSATRHGTCCAATVATSRREAGRAAPDASRASPVVYSLAGRRTRQPVPDLSRAGATAGPPRRTDWGRAAVRGFARPAAAPAGALLDRMRDRYLRQLENRDGIFPIHRGLKFLLLTATVEVDRDDPLSIRCAIAGGCSMRFLRSATRSARSLLTPGCCSTSSRRDHLPFLISGPAADATSCRASLPVRPLSATTAGWHVLRPRAERDRRPDAFCLARWGWLLSGRRRQAGAAHSLSTSRLPADSSPPRKPARLLASARFQATAAGLS